MDIKCIIAPLLLASCLLAGAKEYWIDSQQEFDQYREAAFRPGDVILFKRGQRFGGMFAPTGKGTKQSPILIKCYGPGTQRPRIDAGGKCEAGLRLLDPSFWEVQGLEITNTNGSSEDQGDLYGIHVLAQGTEGIYEHIYIHDCYVHDVNGKVAGKTRGGIHVDMKRLKQSWFHDLRITSNRLVRIGGVGISNSSSCGRVEFKEQGVTPHNLWTQVRVADNYIDTTGRNNVIARCSKDAVYERNVLANSSRYSTGHSIFCFNTDGIQIQYNEAYGNVGEGKDRGGFDADYNCINTTIQYNYSHDNMWFCGIMKRNNRNVVIRYNLSQNEKIGLYFFGFEPRKEARDIHVYNNTHYTRKGLEVAVFPEARTPLNARFENNIFCFEEKGGWGENARGIETRFSNNLYFNLAPHPTDKNPIVGDPGFAAPGQAGTDIDLSTMEALSGYQLQSGSPCLQRAKAIADNGGLDLLKTKLTSGKTDIGAFQRAAGEN